MIYELIKACNDQLCLPSDYVYKCFVLFLIL